MKLTSSKKSCPEKERCNFFKWEKDVKSPCKSPQESPQKKLKSFFDKSPQKNSGKVCEPSMSHSSDNQKSPFKFDPEQLRKMEENRQAALEKQKALFAERMKDFLTEESWKREMSSFFDSESWKRLSMFVASQVKGGKEVYPPTSLLFNALNLCPLDKVKVVILGQDPYIFKGQACGMSFSVPQGVTPPPSLKNIFQELKSNFDDFPLPKHGDLTCWAQQGVLLLNACLTVEREKSNSHQNKGWEEFTDKIIEKVCEKDSKVVFLLWGSFAQKKSVIIKERHVVLTASHPSPKSADKGFFGCGHFKKTNEILQENGQEPINWQVVTVQKAVDKKRKLF